MAGKYLSVKLHLVWSTKGRICLINPQWKDRLHSYLGSVAQFHLARILVVNSQPDHIHACVSLPSTIAIADLVNALKANSTRWIRQNFANQKGFAWQVGYGAFAISDSLVPSVIEYILKQEAHHTRCNFQEEFLDLLENHGIKYDRRYVFG
jgi:REP element-mobilizing transposase RayT